MPLPSLKSKGLEEAFISFCRDLSESFTSNMSAQEVFNILIQIAQQLRSEKMKSGRKGIAQRLDDDDYVRQLADQVQTTSKLPFEEYKYLVKRTANFLDSSSVRSN